MGAEHRFHGHKVRPPRKVVSLSAWRALREGWAVSTNKTLLTAGRVVAGKVEHNEPRPAA